LLTGAAPIAIACKAPVVDSVPFVLFERNIGPNVTGLSYPLDDVFDPIVATHPTDPERIAVSYHSYELTSGSCTQLVSGLRITDDGGQTWREAAGRPWEGTERTPNFHSAIAWGPGPVEGGSARLYWVDTTVPRCDDTKHRVSLAYSDDEGASWSAMKTIHATPPTHGGYPDITVDRNPESPNFGVVYAVYNWFPTASNPPGLRVLASADFGVTWWNMEIPPLGAMPGYPFRYRVGYRVRTAPDGGIYVGFCQYDSTNAYDTHVGRLGFGLARVRFDRATHAFTLQSQRMVKLAHINSFTVGGLPAPGSTDNQRLDVKWTYGLDVDQTTGSVYLALPDYIGPGTVGVPRGTISIGRSDDLGSTWAWHRLGRLPTVNGLPQSPHKPTLAVRDGQVFLGVHGLVDVPCSTSPTAGMATVANYYAVSDDGGETFSGPAAIADSRWDLESLADTRNGAGLRDRADFTADGRIFYVYGDGRMALARSEIAQGRSQIFGAMVSLGD
jgi:hypothetical protein